MTITYSGLIAGERFLREHCDGFDDGTGDGFHIEFVKNLLMEVFRASDVAHEFLLAPPLKPHQSALEDR